MPLPGPESGGKTSSKPRARTLLEHRAEHGRGEPRCEQTDTRSTGAQQQQQQLQPSPRRRSYGRGYGRRARRQQLEELQRQRKH